MRLRPIPSTLALSLLCLFLLVNTSCGSSPKSTDSSDAPEQGMTFQTAQETVNKILAVERDYHARKGYYATMDMLTVERALDLPPGGRGKDGWGYKFEIEATANKFKLTAQCFAPLGKFCSELLADETGQVTMNVKQGQ